MRFLDKIVVDRDLETQWLNVLSLLEYVGCRKIVRSTTFENIDAELIQHVCEEALHSHLLKTLVVARGGEHAYSQEHPWVQSGWKYFQELDQRVSAGLVERAYPFVSAVIEERVMVLYTEYLKKTQDKAVQRVLKQILAQEKRHGDLFHAKTHDHPMYKDFLGIEDQLWSRFEAEIEQTFISSRCLAPGDAPANQQKRTGILKVPSTKTKSTKFSKRNGYNKSPLG